jgi:ABC-2 type transport system ATP-binding protein
MIFASHLTKRYPGRRIAVQDLSFHVQPREVVGFLGPNGSGKSTTMRMLCGYLAPSGGTAKVAGYDVTEHPMEVRARIGYLPENCPLYPEMRVDEYLAFRAGIKGVPRRKRKNRINEVKEFCGLSDDGRRIIGQLSKGYRQRVGLAEALVHDPELLILDEPTIGLDPNQIRHVRDLIKHLAQRHTILLSTHILSEVEAVCDRVIIIKNGKIVASDTTDRLNSQFAGTVNYHVEIKAPRTDVEKEISAIPAVSITEISSAGEWQKLQLACPGSHDPRTDIFNLAHRQGWNLRELHREQPRLEDLFATLTGDAASKEAR